MGFKNGLLQKKRSKLIVTPASARDVTNNPNRDSEPEQNPTIAKGGLPMQPHSGHERLRQTANVCIEVVTVICAAIFFRRFWILHGISFIVLRRTLRLAIAWIDYFLDSGIYEEVKRVSTYVFRYAFKNTEKALSGDSHVRLFFAASWLQNYNAWGYHIWFSILRSQYKHVNKLELSEQQGRLQTTEMLAERRRREKGPQSQSVILG